jgi:hypothetical protein
MIYQIFVQKPVFKKIILGIFYNGLNFAKSGHTDGETFQE